MILPKKILKRALVQSESVILVRIVPSLLLGNSHKKENPNKSQLSTVLARKQKMS